MPMRERIAANIAYMKRVLSPCNPDADATRSEFRSVPFSLGDRVTHYRLPGLYRVATIDRLNGTLFTIRVDKHSDPVETITDDFTSFYLTSL